MADKYCYKGTDVLKNKLGIHDADQLDRAERLITALKQQNPPAQFLVTPAGYKKLHKHIFDDIYSWAGKYRTLNIKKGTSPFLPYEQITREMKTRFTAIIADTGVTSKNPTEFVTAIAQHVNELNAIHPFREGNGRTLQLFLTMMAEKAGHQFDIGQVTPQEWIDASIHGFKTATSVRFKALIEKALQTP